MRRAQRAGKSVFDDLGFSVREAEYLRVRAELLLALQRALTRRRLKQAEVARLLGITQPRVSNVLGGRLDLFSTDALIELVARVGIGVKVTLKRLERSGRVA